MSQSVRDRAMERFRRGKYDILVATDIVSRGIDVDQVSHVINFDAPGTPEAYTFATDEDAHIVRAIERRIGARLVHSEVDGFTVPEPEHESLVGRDAKKRRLNHGRSSGSRPESRGRRRGRPGARPPRRTNR